MDNNPMDKQLYDFLNSYELIQSDFNEQEARERIVSAMEKLGEGENILTGFIAKASQNNEPEVDRAFLITDHNRIISSPDETGSGLIINVEDIESIKTGEGFAQNQLSLLTGDANTIIHAKTDDGAESLSDALYTALSEVLPAERIQSVFDLESGGYEVIDETEEEPIPEQESIDIAEPEMEEAPIIEETEQVYEDVPETEIPQEDMPGFEELNEAPIGPLNEDAPTVDVIDVDIPQEPLNETIPSSEAAGGNDTSAETTPNSGAGAAAVASVDTTPSYSGTEEENPKKGKGGKLSLNKPLLYVAGAVLAVILAVALWNVYNNYSQKAAAKRSAESLVGYLNQIDNIYYTAVDYMNAGPGATSPEQWAELDTQARDIQEELATFQPNELSDNLYQAVYFYDDALLTAIYYGQSFATTGNPLQQSTLQARLESAYQQRLEALSFIESDFPDLEGSIEHATNLDDEPIGFPQAEEAERLQQEANSHPSEGAASRENTQSSNEARENSINSKESQE